MSAFVSITDVLRLGCRFSPAPGGAEGRSSSVGRDIADLKDSWVSRIEPGVIEPGVSGSKDGEAPPRLSARASRAESLLDRRNLYTDSFHASPQAAGVQR